MTERRTVITGIGPVTSIGIGREEWIEAWGCGDCGIRPVEHFDASPYGCGLAAELADFDVEEYLESQKSYLDRASELAFAAAVLALEDAGLDLSALDCSRVGLLLGSAAGSLETMALFYRDYVEKGPRLVKPFLFPHTYNNTAASLIAIEFGLTGHHMSYASGAVSGACALIGACDAIRVGRCDLALAGGYEALGEPLHAAYDRMGALARARSVDAFHGPLDVARTGTVLGEGAGVLVLEEREHALRRDATILGEIRGESWQSWRGGMEAGAVAVEAACAQALADAGVNVTDLACLLVSANGSGALDACEARGLAGLDAEGILATAPKSLTGETLGAGGALQVIAALSVLETRRVAPVAHLGSPDDCARGLRLAMESVRSDNAAVLVTTLDPGGSVVAFVVA